MPTNTETPRQESDREQIATIIQRGHIGHKTSDEIARDVTNYVNKRLDHMCSLEYFTVSLSE